MMNDTIYQKVFDVLAPILPNEWDRMILFVGYSSGSYTMKYYTCDDTGEYTDCFSQKSANKTEIIKAFMQIDRVLKDERALLDDKNRWSVFTLTVSSNGEMKADFDYQDISENAIAYERAWKEKYVT